MKYEDEFNGVKISVDFPHAKNKFEVLVQKCIYAKMREHLKEYTIEEFPRYMRDPHQFGYVFNPNYTILDKELHSLISQDSITKDDD